jgi:hypothetical protein
MDQDGDGVLTVGEVKALVTNHLCGEEEKESDSAVAERTQGFMASFDLDGDGTVRPSPTLSAILCSDYCSGHSVFEMRMC